MINAPAEAIWSVLGDIGSIADWNPGVEKSYLVGDDTELGGRRRCELGGKNYLDEEVVEWIKQFSYPKRFEPLGHGDAFGLRMSCPAQRQFASAPWVLARLRCACWRDNWQRHDLEPNSYSWLPHSRDGLERVGADRP